MKKIFTAFVALLLFSVFLTSCGLTMPRPEVKEGSFDFTVTYELSGEVKTVKDTYVCKYEGVSMTLEGTHDRAWKGTFDGGLAGDSIKICDTADGGEIVLAFLIYPEYFMGEPDYKEFKPTYDLAVYYYDENGYIIDNSDDAEVLASHGVRFIGFEYGDPIENSFN